ncbi:MAG: DciA family protein [bacterium]
MPISLSNVLPKKTRLSRQALRLVANFRDIPEAVTEKPSSGVPLFLGDVLDKALKTKYKRNAKAILLENLQEHWAEWFSGTDFSVGAPERIDRWSCLWIKAPNAILCQKLQFKNDILLKTLNSLLEGAIKDIRWFV